MKNTAKTLFVMLLALFAAVFGSVSAFADGKVSYDGNAKGFIFAPGSELSPTDLFDNLKGVMPGDVATQKITIDNDIDKNTKIKVYMRSLGAVEGSEDFLSKLTLTVKQDGDSVLYDAPADQKAQLSDWVLLGTVYSGGKIDLDLTLLVPAELGNEYAQAAGYIDWQFRVEELPVEPTDPTPPPTGDEGTQPVIYVFIAIAAIAIAVLLLVAVRRKKHGDEIR